MITKRLRLTYAFGTFRVDDPFYGEISPGHAWNIDAENNFIELTGAQFNPWLKEEYHLPSGIIVIRPIDGLRKRYTIERTESFTSLLQ
jgi:hypothetical protein